MISFFLCDDNLKFLNDFEEIVNKYMMKNDLEYEVFTYTKIDNRIKEKIRNTTGFKVFILDIEMGEESGVELARYIREETDDWNSIIMLITAHNELKYDVLSKRLYIFDFINKFDCYKKILFEDLEKTIKHFENLEKKFSYKCGKTIKIISYNDIIMFEKEKGTNQTVIKTNMGEIIIIENINSILKRLDDRFIKINRGVIINKTKIIESDLVNKKITFRNGDIVYDISKKAINAINYV